MKLGWRIWMLGILVALSIILIINIEGGVKLGVLIIFIGILGAISFIESAPKAIGVSLILLALSVWIITASFQTGVIVRSIDRGSPALENGMKNGEIISQVNGETISTKQDYARAIEKMEVGDEYKVDIQTNKDRYVFLANRSIGIAVEDISRTNLKTGLDLRGGARALVQPDVKINDAELSDLIQISQNRFNVFGLSDIQIKGVSDLEGNKFMLIEVAGATPKDLEELISQQGKFEAKVGNRTVFTGGSEDVKSVCRNDASCAGIRSCDPAQGGGYFCNFQFTIYLDPRAAERHADITKNLSLDETGKYLSEKLYLFVDEQEVDSLYISADLRGQSTTQISIQGSGSGTTQEEAYIAAGASMKKLQTILITGSLPYKLNIVKLDTISPNLGETFTKLILLAGIASLVGVSIIIFFRYKRIKASGALLFTSFSEIIIILGIAALVKWNLDLPSIAGILATIGTGVDSQIVILDETVRGRISSLKEKIARALFVIFSAFATSLASLIPIIWAGAGMFKGFAITSIIGLIAGVFISRPAFAEMMKKMEEHNAS